MATELMALINVMALILLCILCSVWCMYELEIRCRLVDQSGIRAEDTALLTPAPYR